MEQEPLPASTLRAPVAKQPRTKKSFWNGSAVLIPIAALIVSNWVAKTLGVLGVALVWVPLLLALWLSSWYSKRTNPNPKLMSSLAWSNTATWLLPPLGLFTSTATLGLSKAPGASTRKYRILGITGLVLSAINGVVGAMLAA